MDGGIYAHQTAVVEEETEGDDGETVVKKKTTGGDPDCYKFFLERAWQLTASERTVGMVMSSSLHNGQGATGLRRLMLEQSRLRVLVKFDNELRVFPGVHNQFKFDIVVLDKGGQTNATDAAFFSRETEQALQLFRSHRAYLKVPAAEIRKLSPQTLTLFEFRGQRDVDLVQKAYRLHPTFGEGLMPRLGLKYRCEFHMGNMVYLFRTRDWLRQHGCTQELGEQWRAADAQWYAERGYVERPLAHWYVLYQGDKVVAHKIPWEVKTAKGIKVQDLDDFTIQFKLSGGFRFFGKPPDDGGHDSVFVPADEVRDTDFPAYIPAAKKLKDFTFGPAIRPGEVFVPLMEGKWLHQHNDHRFAYVSGSGSWVVTRPCEFPEHDTIPQYFMGLVDTRHRTIPYCKVCFRNVSKSSDERTLIALALDGRKPCGHSLNLFHPSRECDAEVFFTACWMNSFALDFITRFLTSGNNTLSLFSLLPAPLPDTRILSDVNSFRGRSLTGAERAMIDAQFACWFEFTPTDYAYILTTFPLLDRDQPPLPHEYRIRVTNKGTEWKPISFVTRDVALLAYFDYLSGRLDVKPDPKRLQRICPDGVPEPPEDIVEFFTEAGVDIGGQTEYAVASTGPCRNLRERVALARELGAVAYVPTIDRRRATFVEQAAAAGGLSPAEGVLTPEMAARVLRDKAAREAKWDKAMELWELTPDPRRIIEQEAVGMAQSDPSQDAVEAI